MSTAIEQRVIRLELLEKLRAEQVAALQAAVAKLQQAVRQGGAGGYPQSGGGGSIVGGAVTTAIPTGTVSSPSTTGAVQLYDDGSPSGDPVAVKNIHTLSASIAVGKAVQLASIGSDLYLLSADC